MGIRFACHVCDKKLNIKRELAGRRGVCPACSARFRIPAEDAEKSIPVDSAVGVETASQPGSCPSITPATPSNAPATPSGADIARASDAVVSTGSSGNVSEDVFHDPLDEQASGSSTSLLDEDPAATWYVRPPSGGQYGPASSEILRQWIGEGRVASTALLWRDGWQQWREASETLPELAPRLPNGNAASRVQSPVDPVKPAASSTSPQLSGQASVGKERRSRSMRRVLLIGVLSALTVTLIGVLLIMMN